MTPSLSSKEKGWPGAYLFAKGFLNKLLRHGKRKKATSAALESGGLMHETLIMEEFIRIYLIYNSSNFPSSRPTLEFPILG